MTRLLLLGGILAPLTSVCHAQSNVITEFPLTSSAASFPENIVYGTNAFTTNSGYWFTEFSGQRIGYIDTTSNILSEIGLIGAANPFGIVNTNNTIWFTESGSGRIGYVTNNTFVDFALPNAASQPATLISGPGGLLWFIEYNLNKIAAVAPIAPTNGVLALAHEYGPFSHPGSLSSQMLGLTTGPDGNIWFAEATWGIIGRLNPITGVSNEFALPQTNCEPNSIVSGPDGALWFTEFTGNKIGRITTDGVSGTNVHITEYSLPISPSYPNPQPYGILSPGDGNLWFTEYYGGAVGRFTPSTVAPSGVITIFPTPTAASTPTYLAMGTGPDTNIWFGEHASGGSSQVDDLIGRLNVAQALNLWPSNVTTSGTNFTGTLATFQNANLTNSIIVTWGDGTSNTVLITNSFGTNAVTDGSQSQIFITNVVSSPSVAVSKLTPQVTVSNGVNSLMISNIATNYNGATPVYSYSISGTHTYPGSPAVGPITISITDSFNDYAFASIPLGPTFFAGQAYLTNNVNFLRFANGNLFGYYSLTSFPYVYHFDLHWEYLLLDANSASTPGAVYFYDFDSTHAFYTSPTLFPYIYDFSLSTWLYYYPDPNRAGRYTTGPRYFYNFTTKQIITL